MDNYRIKIHGADMCEKAQHLFFKLGKSWSCKGFNFSFPQEEVWLHTHATQIFWCHDADIQDFIHKTEVTLFELHDVVVLHRNDPEDANYSISVASDRPDQLVYKTSDDLFYTYSENNGKWVLCKSIVSTTTGLKRITKETLNNIAKTAEVHREHNLANELNDLCAEFGCPPGADRMRWLRDHLRGTRQPETLYHYSASINTARGTVSYDGVITFPSRITGIEDYQQARAEIAKDGNVAPDQVNVLSLSVIN